MFEKFKMSKFMFEKTIFGYVHPLITQLFH